MKTLKNLIVVSLTFAMLFSVFVNIGYVNANSSENRASTDKPVILPDFIEAAILVMYQNAPEGKLEEARIQCAEQLAFNEKQIAQTNGEILNYTPTRATKYINSFNRTEDVWGGYTYNPTNVVGTPDINYARFYTPKADQAAQVVGNFSGTASGAVYVAAKLGPTGSGQNGNYIVVFGSVNGTDWTWDCLGYAAITTSYSATYPVYYYAGTAYLGYTQITLAAVTTTGGMVTYNDIQVDAVSFG